MRTILDFGNVSRISVKVQKREYLTGSRYETNCSCQKRKFFTRTCDGTAIKKGEAVVEIKYRVNTQRMPDDTVRVWYKTYRFRVNCFAIALFGDQELILKSYKDEVKEKEISKETNRRQRAIKRSGKAQGQPDRRRKLEGLTEKEKSERSKWLSKRNAYRQLLNKYLSRPKPYNERTIQGINNAGQQIALATEWILAQDEHIAEIKKSVPVVPKPEINTDRAQPFQDILDRAESELADARRVFPDLFPLSSPPHQLPLI